MVFFHIQKICIEKYFRRFETPDRGGHFNYFNIYECILTCMVTCLPIAVDIISLWLDT